MSRILSQSGNVIAADFTPREFDPASIEIEIRSEVLYCDELVCLMRFHLLLDGTPFTVEHITTQTPPA